MMTVVYYKAVRPDGTSFYDRETHWEIGEVTQHPRRGVSPRRARRAGPENYLSVSTTPTDCTSFQWPARLLVVEPVEGHPVFRPDPEVLPNKRAATAWRVVEERPAHELFGPQGEHLVALIERAARLSGDEVGRLYAAQCAAWDAARAARDDRDAAWNAAGAADRAAAWDAAWAAAWDAAWDAARAAAWDTDRPADRAAAGYTARAAAQAAAGCTARDAARDAAGALVVRDILDPDHYRALIAPWAQAVGKVHPDDPPATHTTITKE